MRVLNLLTFFTKFLLLNLSSWVGEWKLSSIDFLTVLLLEAGGDPLGINDIPFLWLDNVGHPDSDWMLETVPQKNCALAYPNNVTFICLIK